jgi:formylmethanofuran dehydrogenase subunit E
MFKFIAIFVLVWLLFYFFQNKRKLNKVVKCENCGEIIPQKDALIQNGKNYCSKNCL